MGVLVADAVLEEGLQLAREEPVDIGADGTPEDFRGRAAGGGRRRRRRRGRRGVPPAAHGRLAGVRPGAARGGPAVDQADRRELPVHRGHPATSSPSSTRTACRPAGRCRRTPRRSGRSSRWPRSRSTPAGGAARSASCPSCPTSTRRPATRARPPARSASAPTGRDLTDEELIALLGRLRRAAAGHPHGRATPTRRSPRPRRSATRSSLKSTAPWLRHRSDLGGVRLDLADAEAVRTAFAAIPVRRPGDRAGDGRAGRGDRRGDRRRPVVRRAGQLRARRRGHRPARRPRLPHAAAHRPRRRRARPGAAGVAAARRLPRVASRSTSRRWRTCCCGSPAWPTTCPRCCGCAWSRSSSARPSPWHGGRSLVVAGGTCTVGPPTARVEPGPRRMRSAV